MSEPVADFSRETPPDPPAPPSFARVLARVVVGRLGIVVAVPAGVVALGFASFAVGSAMQAGHGPAPVDDIVALGVMAIAGSALVLGIAGIGVYAFIVSAVDEARRRMGDR